MTIDFKQDILAPVATDLPRWISLLMKELLLKLHS